MKVLLVLAVVTVGVTSACTYKSETVERPAAPAATVVATPAPTGTVVYTDPAPAATTTVYTTR
jgi:hypothetical protein